MANVKIYKCLPHIFALALPVCDINILNFYLENVGQGQEEDKRYLRRSIGIMCIADFFHNFSFWQHTKTNEFHIFKHLKLKM